MTQKYNIIILCHEHFQCKSIVSLRDTLYYVFVRDVYERPEYDNKARLHLIRVYLISQNL